MRSWPRWSTQIVSWISRAICRGCQTWFDLQSEGRIRCRCKLELQKNTKGFLLPHALVLVSGGIFHSLSNVHDPSNCRRDGNGNNVGCLTIFQSHWRTHYAFLSSKYLQGSIYSRLKEWFRREWLLLNLRKQLWQLSGKARRLGLLHSVGKLSKKVCGAAENQLYYIIFTFCRSKKCSII